MFASVKLRFLFFIWVSSMANVVDAGFRRSGEFSFDFNCLKFEFSFSSIFSGKSQNFFWYFHIRGFLLTSLKNLNPLLISIAKFRILLLNDLFEIEGWIFFGIQGLMMINCTRSYGKLVQGHLLKFLVMVIEFSTSLKVTWNK